MAARTPSDTGNNHDMILGEMRGQLREMVHGMNNLSQKFDALSREVIGLGPLAVDVAQLQAKVAVLEAEKSRREGASGVVSTIAKSPMVGWVVGGATFMWALLTGRVNI